MQEFEKKDSRNLLLIKCTIRFIVESIFDKGIL